MGSKNTSGLVLGALAIGVGALFMSSRANAAGTTSPLPTAPDEMTRLYQQNPGLYAVIAKALASFSAPDEMNRYAQAVQFSFPGIALALRDKISKTTTIGSSSGRLYWLDPNGAIHVYTRDYNPVVTAKWDSSVGGFYPTEKFPAFNANDYFDGSNISLGSEMKFAADSLQATVYRGPRIS